MSERNTTIENLDPFRALDYLRDTAHEYAVAKANCDHMEEYRKTLKAKLMSEMIGEPVNAQERYAYAHPQYEQFLEDWKTQKEITEHLRWKLEAAKTKISVWQTIQANDRIERKVI